MAQVVNLLHETLANTVNSHFDDSTGIIKMRGIFLQSNVKNGNGRIYEKYWFKDVVNDYITNYIMKNNALGELDHPDYLTVNINKMTHKINSLTEDGDNWIGELETLDLPNDVGVQRIKACVKQGVPLGVSSRAVGRTEKRNSIDYVVAEGFKFGTVADIVLDPSAPEAYITAITEKHQYIWDGDVLLEKQLYDSLKIIDKNPKSSYSMLEKKIYAELIAKSLKK